MASLGSEFAMVLLVNGNWAALARLENELKRHADDLTSWYPLEVILDFRSKRAQNVI